MDDNDPAKRHFVEEVGLVFEESGMTRMAGRILGWLLICDPPYQTLSQLADALQASKGSISSMTRFLIHLGLIERFSKPGERRDYLRILPDAWTRVIDSRMDQLREVRELTERGLTLLENDPPETRQRLEEVHDLYAFLERELPLLIDRWKQSR